MKYEWIGPSGYNPLLGLVTKGQVLENIAEHHLDKLKDYLFEVKSEDKTETKSEDKTETKKKKFTKKEE